MRVIILKETNKPYSSRTFKPGDNVIMDNKHARELIQKKQAAEIPQLIGRIWHLGGAPTQRMSKFWKKIVTLEEYQEYIKPKKEEKK